MKLVSGEPACDRVSQSLAPPKPLASVIVTALDGATDVALTVSTAGGSIVTLTDAEVPPPGAGVATKTCAEVPVMAPAGTIAVSDVVLVTVVVKGVPFHEADENALK